MRSASWRYGVFDRVITLDAVPDGYRAMNEREAIKVMITF